VSILAILGLSVLELGPMYATDRRQTKSSLNAPYLRDGGIITVAGALNKSYRSQVSVVSDVTTAK